MGRAALYEPIDNRRFHEDSRGYNARRGGEGHAARPERAPGRLRLLRSLIPASERLKFLALRRAIIKIPYLSQSQYFAADTGFSYS